MKFNLSARPIAWIGASLATLVLGFALVVSLTDPGSEMAVSADPVSDLPVGSAALRVAIDPETGALVPDLNPAKAMDADLQNMLSRSSDGLVEVTHPDGHVSVHLQGRFMSASIARIDKDGHVETTCVESNEALNDFMSGEDSNHTHAEAEVK